MYNRYILQPDGSYSKRRMEDPIVIDPPPQEPILPQETEPVITALPQQEEPPQPPTPVVQIQKSQPQQNNAGTFLRNLLPKNFDTGDLLIVILLLLMSSDSPADSNTAILTLALYLFL